MRRNAKQFTREFHRARFLDMVRVKRDIEMEKRWERFLMDRAEFDEAITESLDTYEFMMKNEEIR